MVCASIYYFINIDIRTYTGHKYSVHCLIEASSHVYYSRLCSLLLTMDNVEMTSLDVST